MGFVLLLAAAVFLICALQEAGSLAYAWDSPLIVVMLTLAGLCSVAFCCWEASVCAPQVFEPLVPAALVRNRVYAACTV